MINFGRVRYKFDEMSMRTSIQTEAGAEAAVTKIVQVKVQWAALWKIRNEFLRLKLFLPTHLLSVEKCTIPVIRKALDRFCLMPPAAKPFETKTRIPMADQHMSNGGADDTYRHDFPDETVHRFSCHCHIGHKESENIVAAYNNERKGLLHTSLACNFTGAILALKVQLKKVFKTKLQFYDAPGGAGAAAKRYREDVFKQCGATNEFSSRQTLSAKRAAFHRRRVLLNGRYRRAGLPEHLCPGRWCCRDRDHCLERFYNMVDDECFPTVVMFQRWVGIEELVDWCLFWSMCHNLFEEMVLAAFDDQTKMDAPVGEADGDMAPGLPQGDDEDEDDGVYHLPEEELDLPDPIKDSSTEIRQKTFRGNCVAWVKSKPSGRLMTFRTLLRVQQEDQRRLFQAASEKAVVAELARRQAGEAPSFQVVEAADGAFYRVSRAAYSDLISSDAPWAFLPAEFRTHELAVQTFRAASSAICTQYQLRIMQYREHPMKGYLILSKRVAGRDVLIARDLIHTFKRDPCLLGQKWFEHCTRYPSEEELLSPPSLAELQTEAELIQIHNVDIETGNANIYRSIKRGVMQKLVRFEDVSSNFACRTERGYHTSLFGQQTYSHDRALEDTENDKKTKTAGGGGIARAFVSKMASSHRLPSGKLDLTEIWRLYRIEKAKESSEILKSLAEAAVAATRARRQQILNGTKYAMSSFGAVSKKNLKRKDTNTARRTLMNKLKKPDQPTDADAVGCEIVPYTDNIDGMQLASVAGNEMADQISLLRSIARHEASAKREAHDAKRQAIRSALNNSKPSIFDLDFASMDPAHTSVKAAPCGQVSDVYVHTDISAQVTKQVAALSKARTKSLQKDCEHLWQQDHGVITVESAGPPRTIPKASKQPLCFSSGMGKCICKGHGFLLNLAAKNLAKEVCSRAPKNTKMRVLLKSSWIVFRVGEHWWHCGLMYFNPRRPTFLQVKPRPGQVWGHTVIDPIYDSNQLAVTHTVLEAMSCLDLRTPQDLQLYRLIAFNRDLPGWKPDRLLTVAPVHDQIEEVPETIRFWQGASAELTAEMTRRQKQDLAAERKRERDAAPGGPSGSRRGRQSRTTTPQHEAMRAAAKRAMDEELVPLLDVPAGEQTVDEEIFWSELASDVDDEECFAPTDNEEGLDEALNSLASLKQSEGVEGREDNVSDFAEDGLDAELDALFGDCDDLDVGVDDESVPVLSIPSIHGHHEGSDDTDSASYIPTSPASMGAEAEGDITDEECLAAPAAGHRAGVREPATADRSSEQPANCTCRRYEPTGAGKIPYWVGVLSPGMSDASGNHSRSRSYRPGLRTEAEALSEVEIWPHANASAGGDVVPSDSSSSSSESETGSSQS